VYAGRKGGDYVTDPGVLSWKQKKHDTSSQKKIIEATITVDNLVSTMKNINAIREDPKRTNEIFRAAGFLEGILYTGRLVPGKQLVFKNITYVEIGWIGQKE
jgi:hypothetical protein